MSVSLLFNPSQVKFWEGNINLHETMKYKNKRRLLGIKKKNIQAFLENNVQKGIVGFGYFGHVLHKREHLPSVFFFPFNIFTQKMRVNPVLTRACIHLLYVCTKASCNIHTQTDIWQTDCIGSLLSCAERKWSLTVKEWKNTDAGPFSNAHTLYYGVRMGLGALYC